MSNFIAITNLTKRYQMGREKVFALAGVSLTIEENSFSVIMGPSGSGKSTLLYLLGGLDRPTQGEIKVTRYNLETLDENALASYRQKKVGFIFQSFNLIPSLSALENVAFPLRFAHIARAQRQKRAHALLCRVGLEDRIYHKPTELSGGQQQRVAIARALINDPQLVLADEPTGNLDTASGQSIMQLLADLREQGKTIVVVTHDPRMIAYATHTVYMLDGQLVSENVYQSAIAGPMLPA